MKAHGTDTNTWKAILCSGTQRIWLQCPFYPKQYSNTKQTWSNFNGIFHRNRTNILNICVETPRPLNSQSRSEKREQAEGISLPDFTLCDVANSPKKCWTGPKTGTHSTGTEPQHRNRNERPKITLRACGQLTHKKGAKNTHWGKGSPLNKPCHCAPSTPHIKHPFPTSSPSSPGSSEGRHPQQSVTHQNFPPHLSSPLPSTTSWRVPRRPSSCPCELDATRSYDWIPSGSWDQAPISVESPWVVLKPRLSARTQIPTFHKPKPPAGPEETGIPTAECRATSVGTARFPTPAQGGELCVPWQPMGKCRHGLPHRSHQALPPGWLYSRQ